MSSHYPPLTLKDVERILKNLGFTKRPAKEGKGSHEKWVRNDPFRRVDVDPPKSPFGPFLIKSMASQAGVSKKHFYAALDKGVAQKVCKLAYSD